MEARRVLPYVVGLLALAFALGSLPHGAGGGSLLFESTWLLYLIYLGPVVILALIIAAVVVVGMNWRGLGTGIGFGMARSRRMRKRSKYSFVISVLFWLLALGVLINTRGTIFNHDSNSTATNSTINKIVGENAAPPNPFGWGSVVPTISNLIQNTWFGIAFLGLIIVGGLVLVQSVRVAMQETREMNAKEVALRRVAGLQLVNNTLAMMDAGEGDPRSRIIACYHNMIAAVSRLGAPVPPDLTARELEDRIRSTFALEGSSTGELTLLFEEARYSLHDISEKDAENARRCLNSIAEELQVQLDAK